MFRGLAKTKHQEFNKKNLEIQPILQASGIFNRTHPLIYFRHSIFLFL